LVVNFRRLVVISKNLSSLVPRVFIGWIDQSFFLKI
jgi:hypothetical protein